MTKTYIYFDIKYALQTQEMVIKNSGGLSGVKNQGCLESVLENIQNDLYYPELTDKITHLVHSIIKFHAFNDGNKRSSIALGAFFLEVNGLDFCVRKFQNEMENIVVWVAENKIDKELLSKLIDSIIFEDDFSESLKLELLEAITPDGFVFDELEDEGEI
ncbi:MAG: type II toxin-antitoxin system death-on-curing family toxin [Pseudomonadota bacterium]